MADGALDTERLQALAEHLGRSGAEVADTLHAELIAEREAIEAGLRAAEDSDATRLELGIVEHAAHAARNSVLMVGGERLRTALRTLEQAAAAGDLPAARAALQAARAPLAQLIAELRDVG